MATYLSELFLWIFNERQILPNNISSWDEVVSTPGVYYPKMWDIIFPSVVLGLMGLGVRNIYERFIVVPFALYLGIKHKKHINVEKIPALEETYLKDGIPNDQKLQELCKKTNLSERQTQRWFRRRKNIDSPGDMKKFCECSWQFLFYTVMFCFEICVLWDKPWLWNMKANWENYPFHPVSNSIYVFYLLEASYLWNMMFFLFSDHKRKDFTIMVVHHISTMSLIFLSWFMYFVRIGTIVVLVHDASDVWMLAAKLSIYYGKNERLTTAFFVIFVIVWTFTRLIWFPCIIYSTIVNNMEYYDRIIYYVFIALLLVLQVLHIIWSFMIAKIVLEKVSQGKVKDVRSDSEDETLMNNGQTDHIHNDKTFVNGEQNGKQDKVSSNGNNNLKYRPL